MHDGECDSGYGNESSLLSKRFERRDESQSLAVPTK